MTTALLALILSCAVQQLPGGEWSVSLDVPTIGPVAVLGAAGDVNADGTPDLLVGESVRSGIDGSILHEFPGTAMAAMGDVDGDGHADVVVGDRVTNNVRVMSGATGLPLVSIPGMQPGAFGLTVAGAGDVDQDGTPDLIVGHPDLLGFGGTNEVYVHSGASGALLYTFTGTQLGLADGFGWSVDGGADLDGDGVPDVLIGEPGLATGGRAWAYSGATGQLLWSVGGLYGGDDEFGAAVSMAGDLDRDGLADVLIGARREQASAAGGVYALRGSDGALLWHLEGEAGDGLGYHLDGTGDVDGDGDPDAVAGTVLGVGSYAALISGSDGRLIERIGVGALFGAAAAGDLNADGRDQLIIGRTSDFTVHSFDPWLEVTTHELSASGSQGTVIIMRFPPSEEGMRYRVLASYGTLGRTARVNGLAIPLQNTPLFRYTLTGPVGALIYGGVGHVGPGGVSPAFLQYRPAFANVVGTEFRLAAATFDPVTQEGRLSSGAVSITIVP